MRNVGPYEMVDFLGRGGESEVWRGRREDGRSYVIKRGASRAPSREFKLLCDLDHPGIPRPLDCGIEGDRFWFATEFTPGTVLEKGFPEAVDACGFVVAALHALHYLHDNGISHGDVHPGNVFVPARGYPARLIDFGLASREGGVPAGRKGFIAPEVVRGHSRSAASDIYGLAASLKAAGIQRPRIVRELLDAALSADPEVRVSAARDFASCYPRPACGSPIAGRDDVWDRLLALAQRSVSAPQSALLVGPHGMGKSALLAKLVLVLKARGWVVDASAGDSAAELFLRWISLPRPLLVVLDDLSASAARQAAGAIRRMPQEESAGLLVVGATETEEEWPGDLLKLGPVGPTDVSRILRAVTGVASVKPQQAREWILRTGGNPGLATSMGRDVVRSGGVVYRAGAWNLLPNAEAAVPIEAGRLARREVKSVELGARRLLAFASLSAGILSTEEALEATGASPEDLEALLGTGLAVEHGQSLHVRDAAVGTESVALLTESDRVEMHGTIARLAERNGLAPDIVARHALRAKDMDRALTAVLNATRLGRHRRQYPAIKKLLDEAIEAAPESHPLRWKLEFDRLRIESERGADEGVARRAGKFAETCPPSLRSKFLSISLEQWHLLRSAASPKNFNIPSDVAPIFLNFLKARRCFVDGDHREAMRLIEADAELQDSIPGLHLHACVLQARGDARKSARVFVKAIRRSIQDRQVGQEIRLRSSLTGILQEMGKLKFASGMLRRAVAILRETGSDKEAMQVLLMQAYLEGAAGSVGRGLSRMKEWDLLARAYGVADSERGRAEIARGFLLRFAGQHEALLEGNARARRQVAASWKPWLAPARALALMDMGRFDDARAVVRRNWLVYSREKDVVGLSTMEVLNGILAWHTGDVAGLRAMVAVLSTRKNMDANMWSWAAGLKGLLSLREGRVEEALERLREASRHIRHHELLGVEFCAHAILALAEAGQAEEAKSLLSSLEFIPDSPMIQVWMSIAQARCEVTPQGALLKLRSAIELLPLAGEFARAKWYEAGAGYARAVGEDDLSAAWSRLGKESRGMIRALEVQHLRSEPSMGNQTLSAQSRRIQSIVSDINSELNLGKLLSKILDSVLSISGAERGCVVLVENGDPVLRATHRMGQDPDDDTQAFSRTITSQVISTGEIFITGNAAVDRRVGGAVSVRRLNIHSVLCIPFRHRGQTTGCFYLDHRQNADVFDAVSVDALQTLADLATVAIENARLFEENEKARKILEEEASRLKEKLRAVELREMQESEASLKFSYPTLAGRGPAMIRVLHLLDRAAEVDSPVLIEGETGTGKELAARAIHSHGKCATAPFVAENVGAIAEHLLESELFGHVKGAFSGATADHEGLFRRADGGTLFLDEIGELDTNLQVKLLRAVEEGEVRPVGSDKVIKVKVRVITATNRNLEVLAREGRFREDLYFRLAVLRIQLPPLRDRLEDIPVLVRRFLSRHGEIRMEPGAVQSIMKSPWPGNVRQLKNFIDVMAAGVAGVITEKDVDQALEREKRMAWDSFSESLESSVSRFREERVRAALAACGGELSAAAKKLQITYQGLRRLVLKFKLKNVFRHDKATRTVRSVKQKRAQARFRALRKQGKSRPKNR